MENQLFCFYNILSGRYEGVFSMPSDAMCVYRLQNDKSFNRDEYCVFKVGTINVLDGTVDSKRPVRLDIPLVNSDTKNSDGNLPVQEV